MEIDVTRLLGAARREVVDGERAGVAVRIVRVTRTFDTTATDLWEAITTAERLPRWFLPISGDLHLGGRYQLEGNAGGEITACTPPEALGVTWEIGEQVSWLDVRLAPAPEGGTRLELSHAVPLDAHWDEFGAGAVGIGWDLAQMGLELHLATGQPVDPAEVQAWQVTEDARSFVTSCSEAWSQASVAGGEAPDEARAKADRTTAAYTGVG